MPVIDGNVGDEILDSCVVEENILLKLFRKMGIALQRQTRENEINDD